MPVLVYRLLEYSMNDVLFKNFGIEKTDENLKRIVGNPEHTEWVKEAVAITPEAIINYIKMADALGELYKSKRIK